jgi:lipid-binding SYLF domain-containing protein
MRANTFSILGILFAACLNVSAAQASMQDDVDQAVTIVQRFQEMPEKAIPDSVLRNAKGLAILTNYESRVHWQCQRRERDCYCQN